MKDFRRMSAKAVVSTLAAVAVMLWALAPGLSAQGKPGMNNAKGQQQGGQPTTNANGQPVGSGKMRSMTMAQRKAARERQPLQAKGVSVRFAGINSANSARSPLAPLATVPGADARRFAMTGGKRTIEAAPSAPHRMLRKSAGGSDLINLGGLINMLLPRFDLNGNIVFGSGMHKFDTVADPADSVSAPTMMSAPLSGDIDYFGVPNFANSPLPQIDVDGFVIPGTGMRKFQDVLPDLKALIAVPDTKTFPGADYYEISLIDFRFQMHADLPAAGTRLRIYHQTNNGTDPLSGQNTVAPPMASYLGPVIIARKNRPVRVKFTNTLPTGAGGDLFIPTDTTYMGAGNGPDGQPYSQNRANLHLHGGNSPWISDGTPHQWTAAVGENGTNLKGVSVGYVPDMWFDANGALILACAGQTSCDVPNASTNPGPGSLTYYWTNQQTGRLMFYHDHSYGVTRLNVYSGEAAGFLLADPVEEDALAAAGVPGSIGALVGGTSSDAAHLIPLVIQDKSFVPDNGQVGGQLAATDPTWDVTRYGGFGDLWFPHVYMPNQNPADLAGANAFGRWDYGPWFWPAQDPSTYVPGGQPYQCTSSATPAAGWAFPPLLCPGTPNPSGTPEGFMDTPIVNGKAYPTMTVDPTAYRFKILSAGNDRGLNLQWYVADPLAIGLTSGGADYSATPTVTISGGGGVATATAVVEFGSITAINTFVTQPFTSVPTVTITDATGTGAVALTSINTEVKMVPAKRPSTMRPCSTNPNLGATGLGVAVASSLGDNGTGLEAGCWPSSWPVDNRDGGVPDPASAGPAFVQLGTEGGLLPAPVIIPSTPIGYEYNRRSITVLSVGIHGLVLGPAERADVVVDFSQFAGKTLILYNDAPAPMPAFDPRSDYYTGDLDQTDTGGAPSTMPGYGPNTRTLMQVHVGGSANGTPFDPSALIAALPSIYTGTSVQPNQEAPIVPETTYSGTYKAPKDAYSRISDTSMTFTPLGANAATTLAMQPKTIQELFTLDYGRMNATLGVELPFTNFLTQTTIPYGYVDPPTEIFKDGEKQIWKVTHNGVDTHLIHFHLFNVQVINRVGWDGAIKPPDPNEIGWKDTVRMHPLEDVIVALHPLKQDLPWPLPDSIRPLDVTKPVGTTGDMFTNVDPNNNPGTVTNALTNFGWEYVWHCHILGHEENDMMRAMVLQVAPPAPTALSARLGSSQVDLTFTDHAASETGFVIQRSVNDPTFARPVSITVAPSAPSSSFGGVIYAADAFTSGFAPSATDTVYYRVKSVDDFTPQPNSPSYPAPSAMESAWTGIVSLGGLPATSIALTAPAINYGQTAVIGLTVTSAQQPTPAVSGTVTLLVNGNTLTSTLNNGAASFNVAGLQAGTFTVKATFGTQNGYLGSTANATLTVRTLPLTITAPTVNMPYGGPVPALVPSFSAFVAGETNLTALTTQPRCTTTATAASVPGVYAVTCTGAVAPNYAVSYVAGTVKISAIQITPASLTFAAQLVGTNSATQVVTLRNRATTSRTGLSVTVTGTNVTDFTRTTTCGNSLGANATCTITVTFSPKAVGARTATLSIVSNDPASPQTVVLNGTAIAPVLTVSAAPTAFVSPLNIKSAAQTVTVSNTGTAAMTISSIALGGTNANQFAITNGCGTSVAAGASCTVSVTFTPTTTGAKTGSIAVTVAAPATSQTVTLSGTVLVPVLAVSPTSATFSSPFNTASAATTITVSNTGGDTLAISSIALGGTNANQFAVASNNCGATLAAGANCAVTLTFTPTTTGNKSGSLAVTVGTPATSASVTLTGTVLAPALAVTPTSATLSSTLNTSSAATTVTVRNSGTADMAISSIALGGTNANQFVIASNACGTTLAAGASCAVTLTFTPTTTGNKSGSLAVTVGAPATSASVTLTGTVLVPALTVTPTSASFLTDLNTTSAAQTVTVRNSGTAELTISSIALGGTNADQFGMTNACGATLAAGASCTVSLTYSPTVTGNSSASLAVNVAAPATSATVTLTGALPAPALTLTPTSINFGNTTRGTTSAATTVTVRNSGTAAMTISSITLTGTNSAFYRISANTCGASLAAGVSCTVSVTYNPPTTTTTGTKTASLSVQVGAPATSGTVSLTGNAR